MSSRKVTPDNMGAALNEILTDYFEAVVKDTKSAVEATGELAVKTARTYASRIGKGKYAKSLTMEKEADTGRVYMSASVTIYSKQYRLAHLLEHGHVLKSHGRVVGATRAFPHFAPAEALAEATLQKKIEQAIKGA